MAQSVEEPMFSPVQSSSVPAHEVGPYQPNWSIPPRVLVVDDDAVSRTVSSRFLQHTGCSFDVATDGIAAVDKMNVAKYDLVLMVSRGRTPRLHVYQPLQDISMPNLDGLSATSIIRQVTPLHREF